MDTLQNLIPYSPYMILGFLLLAGAFLLKVMYSYADIVYRARALKYAVAGPLSIFKGREQAAKEAMEGEEEEPKPGTFRYLWNRFLIWLGIHTEDEELILSFNGAVEVLKRHLGDVDYKYKLPWFLLLGANESGKSQLIKDVELDLPVGHTEFETENERPPSKWWFFDRGIVIDVLGDYLIYKDECSSDALGWARLMQLLAKHRSKRPLDGIVLTIPADEVYGKKSLSHDEIVARAKYIHAKLWDIQSSLAMRIPVYVVITKTDLIPGFQEFSSELPEESWREMIGWSCPYGLEVGFDSSWTDEAFQHIRTGLNRIRAEIFQRAKVKDNRDGAMVFKVELEKTKEHIRTYLLHIFKESTFHESFFLRGLYFTGDLGTHTAMGEFRRSERYWTPPEALGAAVEVPFEEKDQYHVGYATDLIDKKVFSEYALVRPVNRILRSTNKWLNFAKFAVVALAILWGVGLYYEHGRLRAAQESLQSFVEGVDQTLHNIKRRGFDLTRVEDAQYLNEQTIKILGYMTDINIEDTFSFFIPVSWFSSYDEKVERSFTIAWDEIILRSMFTGLQEKARQLFLSPVQQEADIADGINPVNKPSFKNLYEYVLGVDEFERNVTLFNNLENSESVDDVGRIILYLFKIDLPSQFYENSSYYSSALGQTIDRDVQLLDYQAVGRHKLKQLYDEFLEAVFDPSTSTINQALLIEALDGLRQQASILDFDQLKLHGHIRLIIGVAQIISDPDFKWIERKEFFPDPKYADMLNQVANSRILGVQSANDWAKITQVRFDQYKEGLKGLTAPVIGKIFAVKDKQILAQPSAGYINLVKYLGEFLKQPFMAELQVVQTILPIPPGRLLFWDDATLNQAGSLADSYERYLSENIPLVTPEIRPILKSLGRVSLNRHIFHLIAKAETFRAAPHSITGFDEQEALQTQVYNLKEVQPHFEKILGPNLTGDISMQGGRLRDLMADYAYGMLSRIDQILQREDLYGIGEDQLTWWQGVDMLGLRAFGVYTVEDMKAYLSAQRERITFLAKELAAPILSFLEMDYLRGVHRNQPMRTKWTRIVLQVDAYEKQIPGNSVSILENFLLYELNQVGYENCYELIGTDEPIEKTGDYFLDKRNKIRHFMVNRCENLLKARAIELYNKSAQFFNMYLSGRYPFTEGKNGDYENEAISADVSTFLSLFDQLGAVERQSIINFYEHTGTRESPADFVRQVDLIKPLLQAAIDGTSPMHIPKIDFDVDFRTERNREAGGEQIIDWEVEVDGAEVDFWDKKQEGEWRLGDNITVSLRWAADGTTRPVEHISMPDLHVRNTVAEFKYTGRWSLIRLLKSHATEVTKNTQQTPIVLEFKVPTVPKECVELAGTTRTQPDQFARVYLNFNIKVPGSPEAGKEPEAIKPKPIPYPIFPWHAPVIAKGRTVL